MNTLTTITAARTLAHAVTMPADMKATARKSYALAAFQAAIEDPANSDFRLVAEMLASVLAKPEAKSGDEWADYAIPNSRKIIWPSPILVITFADGQSMRVGAASLAGKPINLGRAVRHAISRYRWRLANAEMIATADRRQWGEAFDDGYRLSLPVPEITSIISEDDGSAYPVDVANRKTDTLRNPWAA